MSLIQLTLFLLARILILVQSLAALMKSNAPFGSFTLKSILPLACLSVFLAFCLLFPNQEWNLVR